MKKRLYCSVLFIVLIFWGWGCTGTNVIPTPTQKSGNVVISTFTAVPTDLPTPSPVPTTDPSVKGNIPGLSPVNVTVALEGRKFTCTNVKKQAAYYQRSCTRGVSSVEMFSVLISGRETFLVDYIEATIRQPKDPDIEIATSIWELLASLPYDGATPEEARAWIEKTIPALSAAPGGAQEMTFGGVKYVLYGPPTELTLEMGELP